MRHFHLDISIGPVGDFIAAGRRSRDLWWGSTWVSECATAIARGLRDDPRAKLHVPSTQRLDAIQRTNDRAYGARIANHLRAVVTAESASELADLVASLDRRAHEHLADILTRCRRRGERILGARDFAELVDLAQWDAQLAAIRAGDFLELYAAWSSEGASAAGDLLTASKSARRFERPIDDSARPKSHLDPGRGSVLREDPRGPQQRLRARLGLGRDEQLDAISLARRLCVFPDNGPELPQLPFPPISRVALDPWLAAVAREHPEPLAELRRHLHLAREHDHYFSLWCSAAVDPEQPPSAAWLRHPCLPFDASLLLEDGPATLNTLWTRTLPASESPTFLATAGTTVAALHRLAGVPEAYYALIAADGDRVGHALQQLPEAQVPELVQSLDDFADHAADLVQAHHGRAFYTGGDDVLAYVPLDVLLWRPDGHPSGLLEALAELFNKYVNTTLKRLLGPDSATSLSFGVALAHVKDDLRAVRHCADAALKQAKQHGARRSTHAGAPLTASLAICERVRSGAERVCQGSLADLTDALRTWVDLCRSGDLSQRSAHALLELHDRFALPLTAPTPRSDGEQATAATTRGDAIGLQLARTSEILRRRRRDAEALPDPLERRLAALERWDDARVLAHEFLLAERLFRAHNLRHPAPLTTSTNAR